MATTFKDNPHLEHVYIKTGTIPEALSSFFFFFNLGSKHEWLARAGLGWEKLRVSCSAVPDPLPTAR